jgi:type VI secretion system protein ImpM
VTAVLLFGKLPSAGDFLSRGLAAAERERLDLWLSAEMAAARERLGAGFESSFDAAPPWRFAWDEGGSWAAGALAPSTDTVGRRFPILVGCRGLRGGQVSPAAEQCEDAIYDAVAEGLDADALCARLGSVSAGEAEPVGEGWWTLGSGSFPEARLGGKMPDGLLLTLLTSIEEAA